MVYTYKCWNNIKSAINVHNWMFLMNYNQFRMGNSDSFLLQLNLLLVTFCQNWAFYIVITKTKKQMNSWCPAVQEKIFISNFWNVVFIIILNCFILTHFLKWIQTPAFRYYSVYQPKMCLILIIIMGLGNNFEYSSYLSHCSVIFSVCDL